MGNSDGYWSRSIEDRDPQFSLRSAEAALYIVCRLLVHLGYFLGLIKCVLTPSTCIKFLGLMVNSSLQAFQIPEEKKSGFARLREIILEGNSTIPLKLVQRFMGKAISLSLAFPGANFFIREMAAGVGSASSKGEVKMTPHLREELEFWRFLDTWASHVPWRQEKHVALTISTDASQSRWAGVIHQQPSDIVLGDFWESEGAHENINVKEIWAVAKVLEALPGEIKDCRVNVQVDNPKLSFTRGWV